jgi:RHS repeat-associated protein
MDMDIQKTGRLMRKAIAHTLVLLMLWLGGVAHAGTVTYVYTDPQGTPLAEADAAGNITATFDYAPYGSQALGTAPNGPGYTGHVNDPDTGLVYMQARYYDPQVGRFISVDPVGPAAGDPFNFNRFAYANNSPSVNIDPDGRCTGSHIEDSSGNCVSTGTTTTMVTATSVTAIRAFSSGGAAFIQYADGATVKRTGSRPWRDNNPGDLRKGSNKSASSRLALGWDHSPTGPHDQVTAKQPFGIFATATVGDRALRETLLSVYGSNSIGEAIQHFAPSVDANNPARYATFITARTGAAPEASINSLTPGQLNGAIEAIKAEEGFNNGGSSQIYDYGLGPFSQ